VLVTVVWSSIVAFIAFKLVDITIGLRPEDMPFSGATLIGGRYPDDGTRHHTYLFAIDDAVVVDAAVGGNAARYLNHSCAPNCDAVIEDGRIWLETVHDIEPGEELVYDYAYVLAERHTPAAKRRYPCGCGAVTCRGTILARKR
jgi:SET domain-containing protein